MVAVFRRAVRAQHATEIGHGTDHKTDAGSAAAFQNADLHALHRLLRGGSRDRRDEQGDGRAGQDEEATHEEISG
jgi:hypothetical protein